MGLSRLDNFLKSVRGTIIYVDPNSIDATDSIENQGNSLTRPFKTIQRALIEASRFSYQRGLDNDRFNRTTILLYPGDHIVDNRPGWIPTSAGQFTLRNGSTSSSMNQFDLLSNFDLTTESNDLYKYNSIYGGVIVPRGTSIVGLDLRKTKVRPRYVPNPENNNIERSAVFRLTGACYLWQFTILDADPNDVCFKDYTTNLFVPNFSHHKLTAFEYADGVNNIAINDTFLTYSSDRTDLQLYYEKIGIAYGPSSGREITPDYPGAVDVQPKIDEYRIVGSKGADIGITSIRSGNGVVGSTDITVTLNSSLSGLDVDTPFKIQGVGAVGYDGQYVVNRVNSSTEIVYRVQNIPQTLVPNVSSAALSLTIDTVTSASPYIFNISLRSVYGMCGLHADGNKASGFKSMVVAQFTGIGLQKDPNAFVKYNTTSGTYEDVTASGNSNINTDSRARFKLDYENYHIKCSNDSYLQIVSVFAIGYAQHFLAQSGGDQSINNSNSNFGAKSLVATGFKPTAFQRDDAGYITHIIPPKEIETTETTIEYYAIDVPKTIGVGVTSRLYLYNQILSSTLPDTVVEGYRIGAKENEYLKVLINQSGISTEYSAKVIIPNTTSTSSEKTFVVGRNVGVNSISNNTITLTSPHNFINGESVRVISNNGSLPDGIQNNQIYYTIVSGIGTDQIKLAQTLNDAVSANPVSINNRGGSLNVVGRVSDKKSGDIGHPVQYDTANNQWYVTVSGISTENTIYSKIVGLGTANLGNATPRTYVTRKPNNRFLIDSVYRVRYVIPADSPISARPPLDGFVIQESNTSIGSSTTEVAYQFNPSTSTLSNSTQLRNPKIISSATWSSNVARINTELPHNLTVGSEVEILNVKSTLNPAGIANTCYNGTFVVTGISSAKQFNFNLPLTSGPGTFTNDTSQRNTSLPYFRRKKLKNTYVIYRSQEIQPYVSGKQDGIYYLLVTNSSNSPSVDPFTTSKFSQPIQNLYPQNNRDNPKSDPKASVSFALPDIIGQVVINDPQNSVTKETLDKEILDFNIGIGITNIISTTGSVHTIYSTIDHGLNRITGLTISNAGSGYVAGNYYGVSLVGAAGSTTGNHANARVTVDGSGLITSVKIMDGGSAYGIGNTLSVVGVTTSAGYTPATLQVTSIYNNLGDTIKIQGITDNDYEKYNILYRITTISDGSTRAFQVASASTISSPAVAGMTTAITNGSTYALTGRSLFSPIATYDRTTGIATVTTSENHGFNVDNKVVIRGTSNTQYDGEFIVKKITSLSNFEVNLGVSTAISASTSNLYVYRPGFVSQGGAINTRSENVGGRLIPTYAGITTTLSAAITDATSESIQITNVTTLDLNIGDFLIIDDEIVRVKQTVTTNPITVFRGLLGTRKSTHVSGSVVRKIDPTPIEFRRNSIIRASSHTFEYLGFGPGNYSTAFPDKQDRNITPQEQILSQSTKQDGGIVVFTGMNADGDFYVGNKKLNSTTGQEEIFDSPIPTVTGEDPGTNKGFSVGFDILSPIEVSINRSLRVEGGENADIISQFDGPVVFNNKVTSVSDKGFEANSLLLQGNANVSRKYTVGISTPTLAGNPGDVAYKDNPTKGGYLGWIYTTDNDWYRFGNVGISKTQNIGIFDGVGIKTDSLGNYDLFVNGNTNLAGNLFVSGTIGGNFQLDSIWKSDAIGIHTTSSVGLGTNSAKAGYALYANGNSEIEGSLRVYEIIEKATIINTSLTGFVNLDLKNNNVYYYTSNASGNWAINFRGDSGQSLDSFMRIGESITVAVLTTQGSTAFVNNIVQIDGSTVSPKYYGGLPITTGNTNSIDLYTYVIIKIAANTFTVLYSQSQYT
jgi:hypothetical protein